MHVLGKASLVLTGYPSGLFTERTKWLRWNHIVKDLKEPHYLLREVDLINGAARSGFESSTPFTGFSYGPE